MRYAILGDMHVNLTAFQAVLEDINYLQNLAIKLTQGDFTLVHGSPRQAHLGILAISRRC